MPTIAVFSAASAANASNGGRSTIQPETKKEAQKFLDDAMLLLGDGGGGGGGALDMETSLEAAHAVEAALEVLPSNAPVAPEVFLVGGVSYQGGGHFGQAAAMYAKGVLAASSSSSSAAVAAEGDAKSATAKSAEEGLASVIATMVSATVSKVDGGEEEQKETLGVGATEDVKAKILSTLDEADGARSDELAKIIDQVAERVLDERARAQEPAHMQVGR